MSPDIIFSPRGLPLHLLNRLIRQQSWITRLLFGVKVNGEERIHWDFTTLALRRSLLRYARNGLTILEIGTGPYALLSIFLARHLQECKITASDINREYLDCAIRTAHRNGVSIDFVRSDLFERINGRFDLIFFNAVYIPRETGRRTGINRLHARETDWCGGETGAEIIEQFLNQARFHIHIGSFIMLGFNPGYLPSALVKDVYTRFGYSPQKTISGFFNPSRVLVLARRSA